MWPALSPQLRRFLAGLAWYAIETRRLRVISHRQSETASAQLEGSVVPCVLFLEDPCQPGDATERP